MNENNKKIAIINKETKIEIQKLDVYDYNDLMYTIVEKAIGKNYRKTVYIEEGQEIIPYTEIKQELE